MVAPLGNACRVRVDRSDDALWLLAGSAEAMLRQSRRFSTTRVVPRSTFQVDYDTRISRPEFEQLLSGIPEVEVMVIRPEKRALPTAGPREEECEPMFFRTVLNDWHGHGSLTTQHPTTDRGQTVLILGDPSDPHRGPVGPREVRSCASSRRLNKSGPT